MRSTQIRGKRPHRDRHTGIYWAATPSRQNLTSAKDTSDSQRTKSKRHDFPYSPISQPRHSLCAAPPYSHRATSPSFQCAAPPTRYPSDAPRLHRRRQSASSRHVNGVVRRTGLPVFRARIIAIFIASLARRDSSSRSSCVTDTMDHPKALNCIRLCVSRRH